MKRAWFILVAGVALGIAAYASVYFAGTSSERAVNRSGQPALAWLQQEFHLSDAEFAKIRDLHEAYRPTCAEMCRRINEKDAQLQLLLAATNVVTPEISKALSEAAELRAECQAHMLNHFYSVAQAMPPEEGRRYLAWVQSETLTPADMMPSRPPASAPTRMP